MKDIENKGKVYVIQEVSKFNVIDRKSTRLNSSHGYISYAVFCLKKKTEEEILIMSLV